MIHRNARTNLTTAVARRVIALSGFLWVAAVAAFAVITGLARMRDDREGAAAAAQRALAHVDRATRLPSQEDLAALVGRDERIRAAACLRFDGVLCAAWPESAGPATQKAPVSRDPGSEPDSWSNAQGETKVWRVNLPLAAREASVVAWVNATNVVRPTLQSTLIFGGALLLATFLGAAVCVQWFGGAWSCVVRDLTRILQLGAGSDADWSPSAAYADTAALRRQITVSAGDLAEARLRIDCLEQQMQRTLQHRERTFARSLEKTRRDSLTDPLTGLYNRRFLEEELPGILADLEAGDSDVTVVMLDLDHFKQHNDTHGHEAGDALLRFVGELLRGATRDSDYCIRYGGDEFAIVMPDTAPENAVPLVERILKLFAQYTAVLKTEPRVSLSAGVAGSASRTREERKQLIKLADRALYQAKRLGKNRVAVAA